MQTVIDILAALICFSGIIGGILFIYYFNVVDLKTKTSKKMRRDLYELVEKGRRNE